MLSVNGRFLSRPPTGVDRVAMEISSRLQTPHRMEVPSPGAAGGIRGQLWEQITLARVARGNLLWSPCNFGPISHPAHVVTVHDLAPLDVPSTFSPRYVAATRARYALLLRRVRHVCTVSDFTLGRLVHHYPNVADRASVIRPGLDAVISRQPTPPVVRGRYLLAVGARDPRKDLRTVLEAWRSMDDHADCRLVVVGDVTGGVFADSGHPGDVPDVVFAGRVTDEELHDLYVGAVAFVTASTYEGFGLPPLEAARRGCPVIASDIPAHREHGHAYDWFPAGSAEALRELLAQRVHADYPIRRAVADAGGGRTWSDAAAAYDELLARV